MTVDAGRVIVVGSINADWVVDVPRLPGPGETVVGASIARLHGGKGANQAVAAARSGARVVIVAAVGDDEIGDRELGALRAAGVDISHVQQVATAPTGLAMISVDPAGENQIVVAPGANAELSGTAVEGALRSIAPGPRDVLLTCNEIPEDAVLAAIEHAGRRRAQVILNPAPPRPIAPNALHHLTLLTPNASEACALSGAGDPLPAAAALSAQTGAAVAVTTGASGALLVTAAAQPPSRIPAPPCEPVDTVGAGDVFNGVLAARLAAGVALPAAVTEAVRRASESTGWPGARAPADWPRWDGRDNGAC